MCFAGRTRSEIHFLHCNASTTIAGVMEMTDMHFKSIFCVLCEWRAEAEIVIKSAFRGRRGNNDAHKVNTASAD